MHEVVGDIDTRECLRESDSNGDVSDYDLVQSGWSAAGVADESAHPMTLLLQLSRDAAAVVAAGTDNENFHDTLPRAGRVTVCGGVCPYFPGRDPPDRHHDRHTDG